MLQKLKQKLLKSYQGLSKKQKRLFFSFLFLLIIGIGVSATITFDRLQKEEKTDATQENSQIPQLDDDLSQIASDDQKELNILLIGYGGAGHQGGMLADLIQIAHIDFENKIIAFISIPRDLELKLNDGSYRKINTVFSSHMSGPEPIINAGQVSKNLLSSVTNLNIKYFIAIDFVGFQRLVGQELGSIEVEVKKDFADQWYPVEGRQLDPCGHSNEEIAHLTETLSGFELEKQFACRYEKIYFSAGTQKMEGGDALKYVRSRHSSSDFDRSRRQVEVLAGIRKKLFDLDALNNIPRFFKQVDQHVASDFDLTILQYFAPLLINANNFAIKNINISTENVLTGSKSSNGSVLIPKAGHNNWSGLQNFIQQGIASEAILSEAPTGE